MTASVIMQTANMQKRAAFLTCRFSLGSMPLTPYFIMHQKEILPPPKFNKHNKSNVSFMKKKKSPFSTIKNGMSLALPSMELFAITTTTSTAAAVLFGYFW